MQIHPLLVNQAYFLQNILYQRLIASFTSNSSPSKAEILRLPMASFDFMMIKKNEKNIAGLNILFFLCLQDVVDLFWSCLCPASWVVLFLHQWTDRGLLL